MYNQEIAVQKSPVNGFLEHKTKGLNHPQVGYIDIYDVSAAAGNIDLLAKRLG